MQKLIARGDQVYFVDNFHDYYLEAEVGSDMTIRRGISALTEASFCNFLIEGNDNIRDLGSWLVSRGTSETNPDEDVIFVEQNEKKHRLAAIAIHASGNPEVDIEEVFDESLNQVVGGMLAHSATGDEDDLWAALDDIETMLSNGFRMIDEHAGFASTGQYASKLHPLLEEKQEKTGIVVPAGYNTILIAEQELRRVDFMHSISRVPNGALAPLGNWMLEGVNSIPSSIFG